jgi:hypothetical protein
MTPFNILTHEIEDTKLGKNHGPMAPRMFSNGAQEYFDKYGANIKHLAQIGMFRFPSNTSGSVDARLPSLSVEEP